MGLLSLTGSSSHSLENVNFCGLGGIIVQQLKEDQVRKEIQNKQRVHFFWYLDWRGLFPTVTLLVTYRKFMFYSKHNSNNSATTRVTDRIWLRQIKRDKPAKWKKPPRLSFFIGQRVKLYSFKCSSSNSTRSTTARLCRAQKVWLLRDSEF